ncbi:PREDICTED: uncharacterized protein LOC106816486 [Priapulus caudatus]|uniref:Uncharacterized protein LOC106816486 n=1 Tax=Priapulus caudatus TaxID=37621 RepID=A0ABM1EWM6_PRICU|nr:PREDICTED: uncharacterized protein LOC106816486 [Priapulus caudatus]
MAEREGPTFAVGVHTTTTRLTVGVGRGRPIRCHNECEHHLPRPADQPTDSPVPNQLIYLEDQLSLLKKEHQEAMTTVEKALARANAACAEAGRKADRERDAATTKLADLAGRAHSLQECLEYARVDFDQVLREKQQLHTQLQKSHSCIVQMLGELSTTLAENA